MTRLREVDVHPIPGKLLGYDADLRRRTGLSLRQIACRAAEVEEDEAANILEGLTVAAVPVGSGRGTIAGFSESVAAIVSHLGFRAFVTEHHDVAGIAEGIERGGDILMLADDERFLAFAPGSHRMVDNVWATARGFVSGLEAMSRGLKGESVLVLGCGPVGVAAAESLLERGAEVSLYDMDQERGLSALGRIGQGTSTRVRWEERGTAALDGYRLVFDATNAGGFIERSHLTTETLVAAPGMPCGLTPEALAENQDRILHDALEIGTATMVIRSASDLRRVQGLREGGEE